MRRLVIHGIAYVVWAITLTLLLSATARDTLWRLVHGAPSAGDHARTLIPGINEALARAPAGFVFIAGDSHAALMGGAPLCGRPVVNGGAGGANAKVYAGLARELTFRARPSATVLVIGTNDLLLKNRPSLPANLAWRVNQAETVVNLLAARGGRLVMTMVPPVSERVARKFDLVALETLSGELRRLCEEVRDCHFTDLFADARSTALGIARPGALADDLHLAGYETARRGAEALICPVGALSAERSP